MPHNLLHCCHIHMSFTVRNFDCLLLALTEQVSHQSLSIENIHILNTAFYII